MGETHIILMVLALGLAPGLFWLYYFYELDKLEPEPLHLIRNSFFYGAAVVIPAAILEQLLAFSQFFTIVIVAPIVEESLKFIAVLVTIYGHEEFDEPMDGVIYAAATALGFASLENVLYLYQAYAAADGSFPTVTLIRAVFSVPAHAAFAIMWGYALGLAKFSDRELGRKLLIVGFFLGVVFHAIFNLLAVTGPLWAFGMVVFIPVMWGMVHRKIAHAIESSPHFAPRDPYSKSALPLVDGEKGVWYENRLIVLLLLYLVFPPIGAYGLAKNRSMSPPEKWAHAVLYLIVGALFGIALGIE